MNHSLEASATKYCRHQWETSVTVSDAATYIALGQMNPTKIIRPVQVLKYVRKQ